MLDDTSGKLRLGPLTKVGMTLSGIRTIVNREIAVKAIETVNSRWAMKMKL